MMTFNKWCWRMCHIILLMLLVGSIWSIWPVSAWVIVMLCCAYWIIRNILIDLQRSQEMAWKDLNEEDHRL